MRTKVLWPAVFRSESSHVSILREASADSRCCWKTMCDSGETWARKVRGTVLSSTRSSPSICAPRMLASRIWPLRFSRISPTGAIKVAEILPLRFFDSSAAVEELFVLKLQLGFVYAQLAEV